MSNSLTTWFNKKHFEPFQDLQNFEKSMENLFKEMMQFKKAGDKEFEFSPSCEICDENDKYTVKFDMPGVKKEQIKVEANDGQLTVQAERREEKKTETKKKFVSEISYGNYSRVFGLPADADTKKVDAKFENGVLTVAIPKAASSGVKQIPVN
jgi:HSP20 family protein